VYASIFLSLFLSSSRWHAVFRPVAIIHRYSLPHVHACTHADLASLVARSFDTIRSIAVIALLDTRNVNVELTNGPLAQFGFRRVINDIILSRPAGRYICIQICLERRRPAHMPLGPLGERGVGREKAVKLQQSRRRIFRTTRPRGDIPYSRKMRRFSRGYTYTDNRNRTPIIPEKCHALGSKNSS